MLTKSVLALVLAAVTVGMVFGQMEYKNDMPMNSVGIDVGPLILGSSIGSFLNWVTGSQIDTWGFGVAAQYERQILSNLTVGIKLGYLGCGIGIPLSEEEDDISLKATLGLRIDSINVEGHVRYYPAENIFFLDGMLGYGCLSNTFSGEILVSEDGRIQKEAASLTIARNYFTLGAKTGWRIGFNKLGGFYFEPSFGYYWCISTSDSFGKAYTSISSDGEADQLRISAIDTLFIFIENIVFIGGPRFSFVFGWRF